MSHLIRHGHQQPQGELIATRRVKPVEQEKVKLGRYHRDLPPKGYIVEYEPRVEAAASIVTKIITIKVDKTDMYELVLFFANFSEYTLIVKVWRL